MRVCRLAFMSRLRFSTMLLMQLSRARQRVWDWMACRQMGHSSFFLRHCLMQWQQKLWAQFRMTACRQYRYRLKGLFYYSIYRRNNTADENIKDDIISTLNPTSMKSSEHMMHWSSFSRTSVTCVTTSSFWALAFSFSSCKNKWIIDAKPNCAKSVLKWLWIQSYLCHFQLFVFGQENLFKALPRKGKFADYFLLLRMLKTSKN